MHRNLVADQPFTPKPTPSGAKIINGETQKERRVKMTDSKKYSVAGADVEVTLSGYVNTIDVHITLDLSNLDADEPDHSPHQLINYVTLQNYRTYNTYWWCKLHRKITVKTGSQARRVIKNAITKIDDAVSKAVILRDMRKADIRSAIV